MISLKHAGAIISVLPNLTIKDLERFIRNIHIDPSGCWRYNRSNSYGKFSWLKERRRDDRHQINAHVLAWMLANGRAIAPSMIICHKCDTPWCVRPAHLFEGTSADNSRDMAIKGRAARGERNGKYTHPNTQIGETHPNAKLSWTAVKQIRNRSINGENDASIAKDYGVTRDCIYRVKAYLNWKEA